MFFLTPENHHTVCCHECSLILHTIDICFINMIDHSHLLQAFTPITLFMEYLGKPLSSLCHPPLLLSSYLPQITSKMDAIPILTTPNQNTVSNFINVIILTRYFLVFCLLIRRFPHTSPSTGSTPVIACFSFVQSSQDPLLSLNCIGPSNI